MLQKSMITMMTLTLFAAAACTPSKTKLALNKGIPAGKNGGGATTQNQEVNKLVAGKKCLPLFDLVKQLSGAVESGATDDQKAQGAKTGQKNFVIYIQNRVLMNAGSYGEDPKENFGVVVNPLTMIIESKFGSQLVKSELIGSLLSVTPESNCETVVFTVPGDTTGNSNSEFSVQLGVNANAPATKNQTSPNRLTLVNARTHQTRDYTIDSSGDNLRIDVTELNPGVTACDGNKPATMYTKTTFIMNLSGRETGLTLNTPFAKLLADSMRNSGFSLPDPKDNTTPATKPGQKVPARLSPTFSSVSFPVTAPLLWTLNTEIKQKNFKDPSCKQP